MKPWERNWGKQTAAPDSPPATSQPSNEKDKPLKPWDRDWQNYGEQRAWEIGMDPASFGVTPVVPPNRRTAVREQVIPELEGGVSEDNRITWMDRVSYELSRSRPSEVEKKFYKDYPDGDFKPFEVDGIGTIYAVKTDKDQESWSLINPVGFDKGDFASLVAHSPQIAGSIGAAILTRSASWKVQTLADFLGPQVGTWAQEGWEWLRGVQDESATGIVKRTTAEGALDVAGGRIAAGATGLRNTIRQGAILDDAGQRTVEAALRSGKVFPSPDRLSSNRVIKRFSMQSRAASDVMHETDRLVQEQLKQDALELAGEGGPRSGQLLRDTILPQKIKEYEARQLGRLPYVEQARYRIAGKGFGEGVDNYIKNTAVTRDKLYDRAFNRLRSQNLDAAGFDVGEPVEVANGILKGIPATGLRRDATGALFTEDFTIEKASAELRRLAKQVARMGTDDVSATQSFETLKDLRTQVYDLQIASKISGHDSQSRMAKDLYMALTRSMDNPVGVDDPVFSKMWKRASHYNALRDGRINKSRVIQDIVKNQSPTSLAKEFAEPTKYDDLLLIRKTVGSKPFKEFQDAWKRDLLFNAQHKGYRAGDTITSQLDRWHQTDPEALRLMLTEAEEKTFRDVAKELETLRTSKYVQLLDDQYEGGKIAYEMVHDVGPDEMRRAIDFVGGPGSPGHKALQESMADYIFLKNLKRNTGEGGRIFLDAQGLSRDINQLLNADMRVRGVLGELFSPEELQRIKDLEEVQSVFTKIGADPGASLEVAQDISSLKNVTRGDIMGTIRGAHGLLFNRMLGRVMLSEKAQKVLTGTRKPKVTNAFLRSTVNGLIQARKGLDQVISEGHEELRDFISNYSERDTAIETLRNVPGVP